MADFTSLGAADAVAFMVSAGLVYEVVAAACSSPQTTEINADKRAGTLMKWVYLGLGQSAILVGVAAVMASQTGGNPKAVIAGGATAGLFMWASYWHARDCGTRSNLPGTETY